MKQTITTQLIQTLAHELQQPTVINLYDTLYAYLQNNTRYHNENFKNPNIYKNALPQGEHFAIQQAIDNVFCHCENYQLVETSPKGSYFPKIELTNLIIVPRRSVSRTSWQQANYLKELAILNKPLDPQLELFDPPKPNDKILLIMDIMYEFDTLYIKYILPSSNLQSILANICYTDIIKEYEKPIQTKTKNPTAKLKKLLHNTTQKVG